MDDWGKHSPGREDSPHKQSEGQSLRGLVEHRENMGLQPEPNGKTQEHLSRGPMSSNLYFKRIALAILLRKIDRDRGKSDRREAT